MRAALVFIGEQPWATVLRHRRLHNGGPAQVRAQAARAARDDRPSRTRCNGTPVVAVAVIQGVLNEPDGRPATTFEGVIA
jgi:hypothetical protein